MRVYLNIVLTRLKKPSMVLSLVSQVATLLLLLGFPVDFRQPLMVATTFCSVLVTLRIMSNPDTKDKEYGEDPLFCTHCGELTSHVEVGGQMVCRDCGTVYRG